MSSSVVSDGRHTWCAVHPNGGWVEGRDPKFTCWLCARGTPADARTPAQPAQLDGPLRAALGLPPDGQAVADLFRAVGLKREGER